MSAAHRLAGALSIKIDSNKPIPKAKGKLKEEQRINKIFRAYAAAYARLYVRKPERFEYVQNGMLKVYPGGEVMTPKRMKQLTRNMNDRRAPTPGV